MSDEMTQEDMNKYWERQARIQRAVDEIDEDEGLDWLHALERRFGWSGTMFTLDDIRIRWQDRREDDEDYTPLTDEQVDNITNTYYWAKAIPEMLCEHGWEIVDMAIDEVMNDNG